MKAPTERDIETLKELACAESDAEAALFGASMFLWILANRAVSKTLTISKSELEDCNPVRARLTTWKDHDGNFHVKAETFQ